MHEILREGVDLALLRPPLLGREPVQRLLPANRGIELEHLQMIRLRQGRQILRRDEDELSIRHLLGHVDQFLHRYFSRNLVHEDVELVHDPEGAFDGRAQRHEHGQRTETSLTP